MKWGRNQKDRNHYLGHSFVYLIASRLHTDMPQAKLNFLNRGNSGNTVADLQKRWEKDALALNPDILTVLVGINDVGRAIRSGGKVDPEAFEKGYHSLLSRSREANSKLKIVLLEPFILPVGKVKTAWSEFYSQVELIRPVVAKLSKVFEAVFIPLQEVFNQAAKQVAPDHWIWDGIHPLPQGHELIARNWIEETAKAWS